MRHINYGIRRHAPFGARSETGVDSVELKGEQKDFNTRGMGDEGNVHVFYAFSPKVRTQTYEYEARL